MQPQRFIRKAKKFFYFSLLAIITTTLSFIGGAKNKQGGANNPFTLKEANADIPACGGGGCDVSCSCDNGTGSCADGSDGSDGACGDGCGW